MKLNRYSILFILAAATTAAAPEQHTLVEGFVTSEVAAAVPGATVGVDSLTRGFHRQTATNVPGYYLVDNLHLDPIRFGQRSKVSAASSTPTWPFLSGNVYVRTFHFAHAKKYPGNCEPVEKKHN